MKLYLYHWSAWMRLGVDFKADGVENALGISSQRRVERCPTADRDARLSAVYEMKWGGVLFGYGNRPVTF
jgi:hypothetical protein